VEQREEYEGDTAEQWERVDEADERVAARAELVTRADRQPREDRGEGDAPDEGGQHRAEDDPGIAPAAPPVGVHLAAPFEGDGAEDQRDDDEEQREVEAGEHRGVPLGERGEHGAGGGDEPHLVAVPHGADRGDHGGTAALVLAEDRQEHPHAEVESLEEEVPGEEHGDEDEPQDLEFDSEDHRPSSSDSAAAEAVAEVNDTGASSSVEPTDP